MQNVMYLKNIDNSREIENRQARQCYNLVPTTEELATMGHV